MILWEFTPEMKTKLKSINLHPSSLFILLHTQMAYVVSFLIKFKLSELKWKYLNACNTESSISALFNPIPVVVTRYTHTRAPSTNTHIHFSLKSFVNVLIEQTIIQQTFMRRSSRPYNACQHNHFAMKFKPNFVYSN